MRKLKASTVLFKAAEQRVKRIVGRFAEFDDDGKPVGYCALGVLGCRAGIIKELDDISGHAIYSKIYDAYGLPSEIGSEIYRLNDGIGQKEHSFRSIAAWLKRKGY